MKLEKGEVQFREITLKLESQLEVDVLYALANWEPLYTALGRGEPGVNVLEDLFQLLRSEKSDKHNHWYDKVSEYFIARERE